MDLHCDLDTAVLIALNVIGWSLFLFVLLKDRVSHHSSSHSTPLPH